jgi:hypothetical protein
LAAKTHEYKKKISCFALFALLFALSFPVEAQQTGKISWIGYLAGAGSGPSPAFIQGLRDLGYVEGKNIAFVYPSAPPISPPS